MKPDRRWWCSLWLSTGIIFYVSIGSAPNLLCAIGAVVAGSICLSAAIRHIQFKP